jgi:hypothetical protein
MTSQMPTAVIPRKTRPKPVSPLPIKVRPNNMHKISAPTLHPTAVAFSPVVLYCPLLMRRLLAQKSDHPSCRFPQALQ